MPSVFLSYHEPLCAALFSYYIGLMIASNVSIIMYDMAAVDIFQVQNDLMIPKINQSHVSMCLEALTIYYGN